MNAFDRMRADREAERAAEYERRMADYFRARVAEAIARLMRDGLSYEQATSEAFDYCTKRWPKLTAAACGEAA